MKNVKLHYITTGHGGHSGGDEFIKIKATPANAPPPPILSENEIPDEKATYEYLKDSSITLDTKRQFVENCFVLEDVFTRLLAKFECSWLPWLHKYQHLV